MKEALFYKRLNDSFVQCGLCPHNCRIPNGKAGFCGVRKNNNGILIAESYGKISSMALDPIEKKPLKMFYPNSYILSAGSYGCNMKCRYCQNHAISQETPYTYFIPPEQLLKTAKEKSNNLGISFTYNEPLIGFEYIFNAAPLFKNAGLKVVLVTNGLINIEPLKILLPYIDAMNIDVKAFDEKIYKDLGGDLDTVKKTVEVSAKTCHVEITSLIVPNQNDKILDIELLADWLCEISSDIPLHITRFFPRYKSVNLQPTPIEIMETLAVKAKKRLKHVFLGNI